MGPTDFRPPARSELLKHDTFGSVLLCTPKQGLAYIVRDTRTAITFARPLARWLMRREARALGRLPAGVPAPRLLALDKHSLTRSFVEGKTMYEAKPTDLDFFKAARKTLHRLHRANITHNDLAKEPNWLVDTRGKPALVDFQLASVHRRRSTLFRLQAREDVRHLLKHKRTYLPESITRRERAILAQPSVPSRVWRATGKRIYWFITRRILHWADREGAADRGRNTR